MLNRGPNLSPEVHHPQLDSCSFPSSERSTLFFLKLKIFYKLSLLPVLNFSSFFFNPQPQSSGKTQIRSFSLPEASITHGYNLNSSHGPSSQALSASPSKVSHCSSAHSLIQDAPAIWPSNVFLPQAFVLAVPSTGNTPPNVPSPPPPTPFPKGLRLTLPLHSGPCSDVSTTEKPSQRPHVESHMPSPSTLTSCLLRPVLFVFTTSLTSYLFCSFVGLGHPSPPYWNVCRLLGLYLCYSSCIPISRTVLRTPWSLINI